MRITVLSVALILHASIPATAGDSTAGEVVFKKRCFVCHAVGPDARNKLGPELNGLFGRQAGSVEGYNYSKANKDSGIVWDEETFEVYIANPRATVPGTKMAFAGLKTDAEIADLIAYLRGFAADGTTAN